jgi:hypothetical protein
MGAQLGIQFTDSQSTAPRIGSIYTQNDRATQVLSMVVSFRSLIGKRYNLSSSCVLGALMLRRKPVQRLLNCDPDNFHLVKDACYSQRSIVCHMVLTRLHLCFCEYPAGARPTGPASLLWYIPRLTKDFPIASYMSSQTLAACMLPMYCSLEFRFRQTTLSVPLR